MFVGDVNQAIYTSLGGVAKERIGGPLQNK